MSFGTFKKTAYQRVPACFAGCGSGGGGSYHIIVRAVYLAKVGHVYAKSRHPVRLSRDKIVADSPFDKIVFAQRVHIQFPEPFVLLVGIIAKEFRSQGRFAFGKFGKAGYFEIFGIISGTGITFQKFSQGPAITLFFVKSY